MTDAERAIEEAAQRSGQFGQPPVTVQTPEEVAAAKLAADHAAWIEATQIPQQGSTDPYMTDTYSLLATPQQSLGTTLTNNLYPANTYRTQPAPTGAEAQAILDSILGPGGQAFGPSKLDATTNMAIPGDVNVSNPYIPSGALTTTFGGNTGVIPPLETVSPASTKEWEYRYDDQEGAYLPYLERTVPGDSPALLTRLKSGLSSLGGSLDDLLTSTAEASTGYQRPLGVDTPIPSAVNRPIGVSTPIPSEVNRYISANMAIPGAMNVPQAQSYSSPFYNPPTPTPQNVIQAQTGSLGANPFAIFQNQGNVAPLFQNVTGVTPSGLTEEEEAQRLLEELEELMLQYGDEF